MAEATVENIVREDFVLTMSRKEAEVLKRVCENVGGCPSSSNRKHTDSINLALYKAGVRECEGRVTGSIYF